MKNQVNLNSSEWCDIIFEGKNKSYGAFQLRQSSSARHLMAFGIIVVFAILVSCLPAIISTIEAATKKPIEAGVTEVYTMIEVDGKKAEEPEFIKPEIPEPPVQEYVAMDKFVPPTIVDDAEATEEQPKGMEELAKSGKVIGLFEVETGSTNPEAVRKELARDIIGDGKGGGAPTEPDIVVHAQQMPQFPGGESEMYRFLNENLKYPVPDIEMGIQGRVTVKFVVNKTGEISDIQLIKGISPTCDREAIRVIKSMPRWIPGKNNGIPVNVYFTMPVVFRLK